MKSLLKEGFRACWSTYYENDGPLLAHVSGPAEGPELSECLVTFEGISLYPDLVVTHHTVHSAYMG